ncbi:hypothetical protein DFH07DRAFT_828155 [Mycena maculata]|uniref:Uncharacterized protein n=1 Tax=Mycena maculata TaxID=230809 RepID=A0AAD7N9A0_9AGAR|nr:hypothetical protein DFH07DRAFT_828155 [Mycena maculata]
MHSPSVVATRPYIWHEVLAAFGSYDKTETGLGRLKRTQMPHIAPFVWAVFLPFHFPAGNSEKFLPLITHAVPLFTSLRAVCLGAFQTHNQPRMYRSLSKVIRTHSTIDTLSVYRMTQCADLIEKSSQATYNIELEYCHGNSDPLLLRPKGIRFMRLHNEEPQNLRTNWPADIWATLKHLNPGPCDVDLPPENHRLILFTSQRYLDQGGRPSLKSLDLSEVYPNELRPWLTLFHKVDLDAFIYNPYNEPTLETLEEILKIFPKVKRLSIGLLDPEDDSDSNSDSDDNSLEIFDLDRDVPDLLSQLTNLEHLTLTVILPDPYAVAEEGGSSGAKARDTGGRNIGPEVSFAAQRSVGLQIGIRERSRHRTVYCPQKREESEC